MEPVVVLDPGGLAWEWHSSQVLTLEETMYCVLIMCTVVCVCVCVCGSTYVIMFVHVCMCMCAYDIV